VPQAKSSSSRSSSKSSRSQTKRSTASKSTGAKRTTRKTAAKKSSGTSRPRATRATASSGSSGAASTAAADPRFDAVAQRVRKLNERIIEDSKTAGEATLAAYEKALKTIASTLERGPGKSDVEWISSLATTQAKWIRDVTAAWTAAARGVLK
jgi:hypothetical protein